MITEQEKEIFEEPQSNIKKIQSEKLQKQMDYIFKNSPFYQKKYHEAGIKRSDIQTLTDLQKLPFTYKDEIRQSQIEQPPFGLHAAAKMEDVIRVHSSSGTTGRPTYTGITRHEIGRAHV